MLIQNKTNNNQTQFFLDINNNHLKFEDPRRQAISRTTKSVPASPVKADNSKNQNTTTSSEDQAAEIKRKLDSEWQKRINKNGKNGKSSKVVKYDKMFAPNLKT
eukprot:CAMPEP_0116985208 /NCGR_PEP_ID=MMETSP0467-20121206/62104_1 /TAXON_ID=283647 /ORGANISM="Mesodinium pulex, Strain SPMC105" /LENGTH=103 /DNA_ID=CAMNT_0004680453 /DNA_START=225 /DNA_END=536 /DNA_ORIENTATION=+